MEQFLALYTLGALIGLIVSYVIYVRQRASSRAWQAEYDRAVLRVMRPQWLARKQASGGR